MREIKFRVWFPKGYYQDSKPFMSYEFLTSYWCGHIFANQNEYKLMQYTGFKDKNGKEIYEGDIVKYKYPCSDYFRGLIYFKDGCFRLYDLYIDDVDTQLEIIGNIYENPELIEDKILQNIDHKSTT